MLKNILNKIIIRYLDKNILVQLLRDTKIATCINQVIIGEKSKFYEESCVTNLSNINSNINIGINTHIRGKLQIFAYGGNIKIGNNCYVGENSYIWSGDSILIGNDVLISHNVNIIDSNSHEIDHIERAEGFKNLITDGHPIDKGNILTKKIIIKDFAWISFGATILKGVTIGKGAIVAAGSMVTKDVPDFALVAGNPAEIIKYTK